MVLVDVLVVPADEGGCGWYRLRHPTRALQADGYPVALSSRYPNATIAEGPLGRRILEVDCPFDVLVLQRTLARETVEAIPVLQKQGVAVVVEIDDDFAHLPKGHPARVTTAPVHSPDMNRLHLKRACDLADLVTVSTPALADVYGHHGRVQVLPNLVPDPWLEYRKPVHDGPVRVGWTGSTHTHIGDLAVTGGGVASGIREAGAELWVVGTGDRVEAQLGHPVDHATGWVPIHDYPLAYQALDVALVPLASNQFNECKSWLKGIEACALGVPVIASPTGPYRELAELGGCVLAETPDDWHRLTCLFGSDATARAEQTARGRHVAQTLTYSQHAPRWWAAWTEALDNRKANR